MSMRDPYTDQTETQPSGSVYDPGRRYGPPPGYGYAPPWAAMRGYGRPFWPRRAAETPSPFLTSEFLVALIAVCALLITVASSDAVGVRFFWTWTSVIVAAYIISRGIAKAGTRTHPSDAHGDVSPLIDRAHAYDDRLQGQNPAGGMERS
jgi:hypothetical protein